MRIRQVLLLYAILDDQLLVSSRLSPCNTQLMRAYYDFNPSLSLLVPVVRMWARFVGLTRMSLNNYAVSLLLIYALQHTTPPVLPCLQNTGAWPRNMEWFATKGFAATTGVSQGRISPGGWKCEFTSPGSLMPSKNTASVGETLLQVVSCMLLAELVSVIMTCRPGGMFCILETIFYQMWQILTCQFGIKPNWRKQQSCSIG